jgi:isomaltose glucohydrolase
VVQHGLRVASVERGAPLPPDQDEVLHARFTTDGAEVPGRWSNFQLDGYGFWLTSLGRHAEAHGPPERVLPAVALVTRYLSVLWDRPCASCWEEDENHRHPTTLCAVAAGLHAAAGLLAEREPAVLAGRITEWVLEHGTAGGALAKVVGDGDLDGSALFVLGPFGPFRSSAPVVDATLDAVEETLVADGGGVHRYLRDGFYGGGLWVPLAGALAWVQALRGNTDRARAVLAWIEGTSDPEGRLPEQSSRRLRRPDLLERWVRRWGPVARPLLWSHAMYLIAGAAIARNDART